MQIKVEVDVAEEVVNRVVGSQVVVEVVVEGICLIFDLPVAFVFSPASHALELLPVDSPVVVVMNDTKRDRYGIRRSINGIGHRVVKR